MERKYLNVFIKDIIKDKLKIYRAVAKIQWEEDYAAALLLFLEGWLGLIHMRINFYTKKVVFILYVSSICNKSLDARSRMGNM